MAEEEEEGVSVEQQLLLACQNGDVDTVHTLVTSVVGMDISLTTEDGATLITNTIIGAGSDCISCTHSATLLLFFCGTRKR